MQAGSMYKKAKVTVLNSRSPVACYVSLPIIDFDEGIDEAVSSVNSTLSSLYHVTVYQAIKDIKFGNRNVLKNEFFALSDNKILNIAPTLRDVTLRTVEHTLNKNDYAVVTLFYGKNVSDDLIDILISVINELGFDVEIARVATFETSYCISITFE
jgi:dihydroxyacetone kinase-like predicted kinase